MPRDDFSARVVRSLRDRVAHKCSSPDCRVPTIGPGSEALAVANIGKAAHIAAAAPGGPRYLAGMTAEERSSINNAIWLCSNCATKIDVDAGTYSIAFLQKWKRSAEQAADAEKGRLPAHPNDALNQLTTALTGLPTHFTHTAICNVHGAAEHVLHALDPRFRVETSYSNKATTYTLHALERVDFKLNIPTPLALEWNEAMQRLRDHGHDVELPASGIEVTGSQLLTQIFDSFDPASAHISFASNKKPAVLKFKLVNAATQQAEQFDDIVGHVSFGGKSITFQGTACGGLLLISFSKHWEQVADDCQTFSLTTSFTPWDRHDVRHLPHLNKLLNLFERLMLGWQIQIELEIDGVVLLSGKAHLPIESGEIGSVCGILQYVDRIRKISGYLALEVLFISGHTITNADLQRAREVVDIIENIKVYSKSSLRSNPTCQLIAQDGGSNIRYLAENSLQDAVLVFRTDGGEVTAFGATISLPRLEAQLSGMHPKILSDISTVKNGDEISMEWETTENFRCSWRYLMPNAEASNPHAVSTENTDVQSSVTTLQRGLGDQ